MVTPSRVLFVLSVILILCIGACAGDDDDQRRVNSSSASGLSGSKADAAGDKVRCNAYCRSPARAVYCT